jgi:hypothetical protein
MVVAALVLVACSSASNDALENESVDSGPIAAGGSTGSGGKVAGTGGAAPTTRDAGTGGAPKAPEAGSAGSAGSGGSAGSAGAPTPVTCATPPSPGLPSGSPALTAGVWKDISQGTGTASMRSCIAVDPCNPAVLYLCTGDFDAAKGGLYKTEDAGGSWRRVGLLDEPNPIRIDPKNPSHLYAGDGVRGGTMGFWVSTDGGETFTMPQSYKDLGSKEGLYQYDVYDVAADPTDFNHVLVSFHGAWGWTDTKWNTSSGVLESKDGGTTWIVHEPMSGWGTGHAINFLGDSSTWLLGTQGAGMWRTTDAGASWTKVTDNGIQHGGGAVYYTKAGVLFATGANQNMRSTDNGASWTLVGPGGGYNGIIGDGTRLYTAKCFGPAPFITSLETDGVTWTDYSSQQFEQGVFRMDFDAVNGIVYSSQWGAGALALKIR